MKTFREFITEEYSRGCLMASITPEGLVRDIQAGIPKESLTSDEDENGDIINGMQKYLHTTVLYGFESDLDVSKLLPFVAPYRGITIDVQKIDHFKNDDSNVCVLKINSNIEKLHWQLRENFKVDLTHKDYKQHITLAYLKRGHFHQQNIKPFKLRVENFIFSTKEGTHITL